MDELTKLRAEVKMLRTIIEKHWGKICESCKDTRPNVKNGFCPKCQPTKVLCTSSDDVDLSLLFRDYAPQASLEKH
jgi:rRNA maturation endonuclease Nob1